MSDLLRYDAVFVISYGGPNGMDDVLPFMRNATRGRGVPDERLMEVSTHYERYDGVSPINACNAQLIEDIKAELKKRGVELPIYLGNRNWHTFVVDALREVMNDGHRKLLMVTTSAYDSYSGCRQYREDMAQAMAELAEEGLPIDELEIDKTRPFYNTPGFLEANIDALVAAAEDAPEDDEACQIVFVTHSIPTGMEAASGNGPEEHRYSNQHLFVAEEVAKKANELLGRNLDWTLVYCSRSGAPHHPWLEPDVNDYLETLQDSQIKHVIVAPIGFISDHMEVVNDLDDEAKETAEEAGLSFSRAATAGTSPKMISSLVDVMEERAAIAAGAPDNESWPTTALKDCCMQYPGYEPLPAIH